MNKTLAALLLSTFLCLITTKMVKINFQCGKCANRTDCQNNLCLSNVEGKKIQACLAHDKCIFEDHFYFSECQKDVFGHVCETGFCAITEQFNDCGIRDTCRSNIVSARCYDGKTSFFMRKLQIFTAEHEQCIFDNNQIIIQKCEKRIFGTDCNCCLGVKSLNINKEANGGFCMKKDDYFSEFIPLITANNTVKVKKINLTQEDITKENQYSQKK